MESLPNELIVEQLYRLPIEAVLSYCRVDRRRARICQNENLWMNLVLRDYPGLPPKLLNESYRNYYFHTVPVIFRYNSGPVTTYNIHVDLFTSEVPRLVSSLTPNSFFAYYLDRQKNYF